MEAQKVLCRCAEGRCFLEEDAARSGQNHAASKDGNGLQRNTALLDKLEIERLRQKDEWMESLGVQGTCQVNCRRQAKKSGGT
ncbi:MAG: hypothetical protein PHX38_04885 [Sulfuricella sp.]|nr:hypothetical protein [Sulfuricella sp.]